MKLPANKPRLQAGDRFPWLHIKLRKNGPVEDLFETLDDMRFNLLVIGQPEVAKEALQLGHLLQTHVIPADPVNEEELARVRIAGPVFYLLRPDGHVGLAGTRLDAAAVTRYLADHLHIRLGVRDQVPTGSRSAFGTSSLERKEH